MPPSSVRSPRIVLRPLSGPDMIADIWAEAVPQDLDTPYGKFKLLRVGQRYVMYLQVAEGDVALVPEFSA